MVILHQVPETSEDDTTEPGVSQLTIRQATPRRAAAIARYLSSLVLRSDRLTPTELEHITTQMAARPELWQDLVIDCPEHRWWLTLLHRPNYVVELLGWEVDQFTDWHDHGGSSGAFSVVEGTLEERYRANAGARTRVRNYSAGSSGCFGPAHVHDVAHRVGHPAVSIHAYSPPIEVQTTYKETPFGLVASGLRTYEPLQSSN